VPDVPDVPDVPEEPEKPEKPEHSEKENDKESLANSHAETMAAQHKLRHSQNQW